MGQRATDRWQCTVCSFEHDPEPETARMAGQGKRYDGEACSVCATARGRAVPVEEGDKAGNTAKHSRQGSDKFLRGFTLKATGGQATQGKTGGCDRQGSKGGKPKEDIRGYMGTSSKSRVGQAHLGEVLHEKGTGQGGGSAGDKIPQWGCGLRRGGDGESNWEYSGRSNRK